MTTRGASRASAKLRPSLFAALLAIPDELVAISKRRRCLLNVAAPFWERNAVHIHTCTPKGRKRSTVHIFGFSDEDSR